VALSHPDAVAAVMNPNSEIATHFATSPFHEVEKRAGFNTITSSYEIMGGESSILTFISTEKFRSENPKVFAIVVAAFEEAMEYTNADLRRLVKIYAEVAEDELYAIVTQPGFKFSKSPATVGAMTEFMHKIGLIKNKPASWKDLFFSEAHGLPGN
jgi:NitT/TauT family transport system substrate-binding protein